MTRIAAPPPSEPVLSGQTWARAWFQWVSRVTSAVGGREPVQFPVYTVAGLPDAADWPQCGVVVSDEVGGETLALSDGTDWRRVTDLAEVTT